MADLTHPLPSGTIIPSIGGHFTYRIVGPCCRLFDREQLPWPCCRIQWHGKEPSWRRIGRRFTPDLAAQKAPSYSVEVLETGCAGETIILTIYSDRLSQEQRDWWYSRRRSNPIEPPRQDTTDGPTVEQQRQEQPIHQTATLTPSPPTVPENTQPEESPHSTNLAQGILSLW